MTISRYSLGTTMVPSLALFKDAMGAIVVAQAVLTGRIERGECLAWTVGLEHFDEMLRTSVTELEMARLGGSSWHRDGRFRRDARVFPSAGDSRQRAASAFV
jgi:hypothetical protein